MDDSAGRDHDSVRPLIARTALTDLAGLAEQVAALRADRDEDRALLEDLLAELARHRIRPPVTETVYATWTDWVDAWLAPRISRSPHRYRWCHHYADHPEIADRLETLWRTWEDHWPDPHTRLTWYRDGLDHHWPLITADDGPLRSCSAQEGVHQVSSTEHKTVDQSEDSFRDNVFRNS